MSHWTCLHFVSVTGCRSYLLSSSEGVEPECADEHGTTLLSEACAGNAKALKKIQIRISACMIVTSMGIALHRPYIGLI